MYVARRQLSGVSRDASSLWYRVVCGVIDDRTGSAKYSAF